jgi:uncharacterized protein (TIGR02271 family)
MRQAEGSKAGVVAMDVADKNGLQGRVVQEVQLSPNSDHWALLQFSNGQLVLVLTELLVRHEDGRYHLTASVEELLAQQVSTQRDSRSGNNFDHLEQRDALRDEDKRQANSAQFIPVVEETMKVHKREQESATVAIHKRVHEHTEVVDLPLQSEEVEIERVDINRVIEAPIPPHYEGDTMIIPLLEEVLVIEKRLILREEVHIKKRHREVHAPQEVLLRKEEVEIERKSFPAEGFQKDDTPQ